MSIETYSVYKIQIIFLKICCTCNLVLFCLLLQLKVFLGLQDKGTDHSFMYSSFGIEMFMLPNIMEICNLKSHNFDGTIWMTLCYIVLSGLVR